MASRAANRETRRETTDQIVHVLAEANRPNPDVVMPGKNIGYYDCKKYRANHCDVLSVFLALRENYKINGVIQQIKNCIYGVYIY